MKIFTNNRQNVPAFNTFEQTQHPNTIFEDGIRNIPNHEMADPKFENANSRQTETL